MNNKAIRDIEPREIWRNFADLNAVPRPSKKEERVVEFIVNFGRDLNLETFVDEIGNVIIKKPATKGLENKKKVVMQSHLDMVHQKNGDTDFDFDTQGILMYTDGDWVRAKGTTLGADNGLGVATIMAVLESDTIGHPALEALFTIDEETGMTGAIGLKGDVLEGEILLNLDTEEDDEIGVGCAGGIDVTAKRSYIEESVPENNIPFQIKVKGLKGGHSGMDIIKGLANANKIMNRLLYDGHENFGMRISSVDGGGLRNAIPRESSAVVVVASEFEEAFCYELEQLAQTITSEYRDVEPGIVIEWSVAEMPDKVMEIEAQTNIIRAIYAAYNGVYRISATIKNLVETSNNIARVLIREGKIEILCLTRSSVDSAKMDLANALRATFELASCEVSLAGDYPGWIPNLNSEILQVAKSQYHKLHDEEPRIMACHAGLECGILGKHYPNMDMTSIGPTILGAHSPDERASISSVQKYWRFLKEILKNIPEK